jgi:metal-sulfur cluster biosynthetic enzyme
VIEKLKTVFDPEIPVNVVDLGLIYVCEAHPLADGGHRVEIKMSMTAPGCGMGDVLKADACRKVQGVAGVTDVDIDIVWEPAWDQSRMGVKRYRSGRDGANHCTCTAMCNPAARGPVSLTRRGRGEDCAWRCKSRRL